jgi:hypothetical protein
LDKEKTNKKSSDILKVQNVSADNALHSDSSKKFNSADLKDE